MRIDNFLIQLGLEQYITKFEEEAIEYDLLESFSEDDFRAMGMKLGHIKKLILAIKSTREKLAMQKESTIFNFAVEFPSIIAVPLFDYLKEPNSKLRLWDICDFIELSLRLVVITGLAQIQNEKGKLSDRVVKEIRNRIEHPTLGKWLGMALAVASDPSVSKKVKELVSFIEKGINGGKHQDEKHSLLALRNFLAHGGSVSQNLAHQLLNVWEAKFEEFVKQLCYFSEFQIIVKDETNYRLLKGNVNTQHIYKLESSEEAKKLSNLITDSRNIVLKLNNEYLPLWPLLFYENAEDYLNPVQNIFVRRGELFLEYTPVGSLNQCQSQSDKDALNSFIQLFQLESHKKQEHEKQFQVRSFENEFLLDAKRFVGRSDHLAQIKNAIHKTDKKVFWITGNAGIGKSYLISATTIDLMEKPNPSLLVLPYRFKAGDDRCYRSEFIKFSVERLNKWSGIDIVIDKPPSTYNLQDFSKLLKHINVKHQVLFILDGFDELPLSDQILANEICEILSLPRTKWICSGRTNPKLEEVFSHFAYKVFPENVPGMDKSDIQSMIYERIGPLRKKVIVGDYERGNVVFNPFIEQVWKYSNGIPLYVTYVIGDILSNRIKSFDGISEKLPPSIFHYHQELVKRCSVGLYQHVLPRLIATIAIAKESLTQEALQDILIKENYLPATEKAKEVMHNCLTYVSQMLRKVSALEEGREGFILYHTSLREFLSEDEESKILLHTARKSLINLINKKTSPESEADIYLLRWGITHLLEDDEDHEKLIISLLGNVSYLQEKLFYQKLEYLFDDFYKSFLLLKDEDAYNTVLDALLALILNNTDKTDTHLTIENVHALLVYRQNQRFYESFLNYAIEKYNNNDKRESFYSSYKKIYPSFLLRKANLSRRKGRLEESQELLQKALDLFESEKNTKEIEKLEYDLGYVQYLQGNIDQAFKHFEKSKQYALINQHEVGYWISYCVQTHARLFDLNNPVSPKDFIIVLNQALPIFMKYAKAGEENAKRWIKNVYQHTFMAAFELNNLMLAEECYQKMVRNEWIQKFDEGNLHKYEARLHWLRGEKEKAAKVFSSYLDNGSMKEESIAREYLLYSLLLKEIGDIEKSKQVGEIGRNCPPHFGNSFFQNATN